MKTYNHKPDWREVPADHVARGQGYASGYWYSLTLNDLCSTHLKHGTLELRPALPEPDWASAPEWADYAVAVPSRVVFFKDKPEISDDLVHWGFGARARVVRTIDAPPTVTARPVASPTPTDAAAAEALLARVKSWRPKVGDLVRVRQDGAEYDGDVGSWCWPGDLGRVLPSTDIDFNGLGNPRVYQDGVWHIFRGALEPVPADAAAPHIEALKALGYEVREVLGEDA
jgi:hypothetical protein